MSRVKEAEEDLRYTLKYVQPLLTIVGAWPISFTSSISLQLVQWFKIFISYFLLSFILIPGVLYLFLKVKAGRTRLKMLAPIVNDLSQLLKYTVLLYRRDEFRRTLDDIKKDWLNTTDENRLILRTKAKIAHRVVLMVAITMYSGGLCYRTILPLSKGRIILPNNMTIRLLPCPGYFVFLNEQLTPNYEIIFTVQVLAGFVSYTLLSGTIGVSALLCLHTISLLRILIKMMIELNDNSEVTETIMQEKITKIVRYQTKIKTFLDNVEQITQYICFIEIADGTFIACALGYCIIMEWENSNSTAIIIYILLQLACIFTVYTVCYIGQLLLDESDNVRQTAGAINWYRIPTKKARCLILIINMSNHSIKLTAAKVIELSFATFTDIMKMSMGYLNMLREVV